MPSRTPRSSDSPKQKPRRASGRPFADATVGRDIILDATVLLLKSRTPEQLSISEIALAAGVTRALVRYYFSDLRGLLGEVTERLMGELQDRMGKALQMRGTVTERVHQRLLLRLEFMREHPHFERLALSEIYHSGSGDAMPDSESPLKRTTRRGLELTSLLLNDSPASTVDPRFVHLAILSVSAFLPNAQPLLVELFGHGAKAERKINEYLWFVSALLADRIEQGDPPDGAAPSPAGKKTAQRTASR